MGKFSALLAICEGNPPVTGGFPPQMPVARSFDVFFDLCLNKWLRKQSRRRRFETPWRSLWRHCNECVSLRDYLSHPQSNQIRLAYFTLYPQLGKEPMINTERYVYIYVYIYPIYIYIQYIQIIKLISVGIFCIGSDEITKSRVYMLQNPFCHFARNLIHTLGSTTA